MIKDAIFIDYNNKKQVKWWNKIALSGLIKFDFLGQVADEETGKICGAVFAIEGLLKKFVVRKNNTFIKDGEEVIIRAKTES